MDACRLQYVKVERRRDTDENSADVLPRSI